MRDNNRDKMSQRAGGGVNSQKKQKSDMEQQAESCGQINDSGEKQSCEECCE